MTPTYPCTVSDQTKYTMMHSGRQSEIITMVFFFLKQANSKISFLKLSTHPITLQSQNVNYLRSTVSFALHTSTPS